MQKTKYSQISNKIIVTFQPIYLAMITKQQIKINYIEEISFKSDAKEDKYQI